MTADAAKKVCSNGACEYESTGKCVEGTALEECSYLGVAQTEQEDTEEPSSVVDDISEEADSGDHIIYDAEPLSVEQASAHMKERTTKIITMIGPAEAGKTSIIAEVYDAFQYQAYKQLRFAGSRTLVGLEKICHKVRGTSRGGDLYQKRTDLKEHPVFYQLSINVLDSHQRDLLISDRSGETYRETRLLHKLWHVIVTRTPTFRVANASQNSPCSIRPCHDCRPIASVAYPHRR